MPQYTVAQFAKTKKEANKIASRARKAGYGATISKVADGYMIRRTANLLKRR